MKKKIHLIPAMYLIIVFGALCVIAAVSWHSVEEIHYLKSFYPDTFTVEEALYASIVEVIKVTFIGAPILLFVGFGYALTRVLSWRKR